MTKYSKLVAGLLIASVAGGLALSYRLLRVPPADSVESLTTEVVRDVPMTAEIVWVPVTDVAAQDWHFVQNGKALAVRVRNPSAVAAKVTDLSHRCEGHGLTGGLVVEAELWDRSGRPVVHKPGVASMQPSSDFVAEDVLAKNPAVFELAGGQSIDLPLSPFPAYTEPGKIDPGTYKVVAVVTWLDAADSQRKEVWSQPTRFKYTVADIARFNARMEFVLQNPFTGSKERRHPGESHSTLTDRI